MKQCYVCIFLAVLYFITVTSRLFTHIVSTEKIRKDMRDRKDMRAIKYTYFTQWAENGVQAAIDIKLS